MNIYMNIVSAPDDIVALFTDTFGNVVCRTYIEDSHRVYQLDKDVQLTEEYFPNLFTWDINNTQSTQILLQLDDVFDGNGSVLRIKSNDQTRIWNGLFLSNAETFPGCMIYRFNVRSDSAFGLFKKNHDQRYPMNLVNPLNYNGGGILIAGGQTCFIVYECIFELDVVNTLNDSCAGNRGGGVITGSGCYNFEIVHCVSYGRTTNNIVTTTGFGYDCAGGLIGPDCDEFTINGCQNYGDVQNYYTGVHPGNNNWNGYVGGGGLTGANCGGFYIYSSITSGNVYNGYIDNSTQMDINDSYDGGGGIVGSDCGEFLCYNCYSTGDVYNTFNGVGINFGYDGGGGITGSDCGAFYIEACFAEGNVINTSNVQELNSGQYEFDLGGGLIGSDSGSATINNSYASGQVINNIVVINSNNGQIDLPGGILGSDSDNVSINNCYWNTNLGVSGDSSSLIVYTNYLGSGQPLDVNTLGLTPLIQNLDPTFYNPLNLEWLPRDNKLPILLANYENLVDFSGVTGSVSIAISVKDYVNYDLPEKPNNLLYGYITINGNRGKFIKSKNVKIGLILSSLPNKTNADKVVQYDGYVILYSRGTLKWKI